MKAPQIPSKKMKEFLHKVDTLCFEYGYEIHPNDQDCTILITGNGETIQLLYIDGDGIED